MPTREPTTLKLWGRPKQQPTGGEVGSGSGAAASKHKNKAGKKQALRERAEAAWEHPAGQTVLAGAAAWLTLRTTIEVLCVRAAPWLPVQACSP